MHNKSHFYIFPFHQWSGDNNGKLHQLILPFTAIVVTEMDLASKIMSSTTQHGQKIYTLELTG
jgi:hypothetical protein